MDAKPSEKHNPIPRKGDAKLDIWIDLVASIIVAEVRKKGQANA